MAQFVLAKTLIKPDSWRLFRYVRADYVRGYENAGKGALALEAASDTATINALYQEAKGHDE